MDILLFAAIILFIILLLFYKKDRKKQAVIAKFESWLTNNDVTFLDTETTGFGRNDEIIEIGIVDNKGNILFERRIMPKCSIPLLSSDIHGITKQMLKAVQAPFWSDIHAELIEILKDKIVIMYNAEYDVRLLKQTCQAHFCLMPEFKYECAMLEYATYRAEPHPNPKYKDYKWHKLTRAAKYEGVKVERAHSAVGDCLLTLNLIKAVVHKHHVRLKST